ncbi:MAG TPA: YbjQ family protein [Chitinophagaceae bacterium]|nr:YbjQ family protein [Chitinophagaceae bacterium]
MIDATMVTTNIELSGYRIIKNLGIVRGITVRSRSLLGNIAGGFQTLIGGRISIYQELCERTREDAFQLMVQQAGERGANAVISMRYDANEVMGGVTEVLAYGTAVVVEKI